MGVSGFLTEPRTWTHLRGGCSCPLKAVVGWGGVECVWEGRVRGVSKPV